MVGALEGRFLEMLVYALRPRWVLEIGTFSGYSRSRWPPACPPADGSPPASSSPVHAEAARAHIAPSPYADRIEVIEGPALDTVKSLDGPFDFVFIDADKTSYLAYYEAVLPKLAPGGLIAADNTLWSGERRRRNRPVRRHQSHPRLQRRRRRRPAGGVRPAHRARRGHPHPAARSPRSRRSVRRRRPPFRARLPPPSLAARATRHGPHRSTRWPPTANGPRPPASPRSRSTEHLFRFAQADRLLRGFWDDEPDAALRVSMESYWDEHARADLDAYVECVLAAKDAGLPVVLGLEVDYYRGRMDDVATLLAGYPFDVLLGSVHWIGTWRFDDLDDAVSMDAVVGATRRRRLVRLRHGHRGARRHSACDVLAHPDLVKAAGHRPAAPEECWDRLVEAAVSLGDGGRAVVGRLAQAGGRGLPRAGTAGARSCAGRRPAHHGVRRPPAGRCGRPVGRPRPHARRPGRGYPARLPGAGARCDVPVGPAVVRS